MIHSLVVANSYQKISVDQIHVEQMQFARQDMTEHNENDQFVRVHQDTLEMHSHHAYEENVKWIQNVLIIVHVSTINVLMLVKEISVDSMRCAQENIILLFVNVHLDIVAMLLLHVVNRRLIQSQDIIDHSKSN